MDLQYLGHRQDHTSSAIAMTANTKPISCLMLRASLNKKMPTRIVPISKNIFTKPELTDTVLLRVNKPKSIYPIGANTKTPTIEYKLLNLAQFVLR